MLRNTQAQLIRISKKTLTFPESTRVCYSVTPS